MDPIASLASGAWVFDASMNVRFALFRFKDFGGASPLS